MFNRGCYAVMLEMLHDNQCCGMSNLCFNYISQFQFNVSVAGNFHVLSSPTRFFVELHNSLHVSFIFVSSLIFDIYCSFFI